MVWLARWPRFLSSHRADLRFWLPMPLCATGDRFDPVLHIMDNSDGPDSSALDCRKARILGGLSGVRTTRSRLERVIASHLNQTSGGACHLSTSGERPGGGVRSP